jgi:hypothetical protein
MQGQKERGTNYNNDRGYCSKSRISKNGSYACHICGLNGHKMTNYPKFVEMHKMFQGKNASTLDGKMVVDVKTIDVEMNVVDVNVATISIITKE